jgi:hypothetical protein
MVQGPSRETINLTVLEDEFRMGNIGWRAKGTVGESLTIVWLNV